MTWQEISALQNFNYLDTVFLLKMTAITLLVILMIYLEDDKSGMDRFTFFIMTAIYGLVIYSLKEAFFQKFGKAQYGVILETAMIGMLCMVYAWMATKRIRDTRYGKSSAYLLCIPIINLLFVLHLFFARPRRRSL